MTKKRKILLYGLLTVFLFLVLALVLLPGIAKNYILDHSKELTGRQVFMDKLSINYFNGKLSVYDFKMFEPNEKDVFISFDTLILNTVPYKYIINTMALDQFYLDGLVVNIAKKDSVFNFDDLVTFYLAKDSTETKLKDDKAFKYILNNLELKSASFNFYDGDVDHTTSIDKFSFFIPQVYWDQENRSDADLKFQIADGGSIEAGFHMQPQTRDFDGHIIVTDLQLKPFYKYAAQHANINDISGKLGTKIDIKGNINTPKDILLSSEVILEDFEMKDTSDKTFLASKKLVGIIPTINLNKNSITVASVVIDQAYANFELDSVSNNFVRIFNIQNESSTDSKPFDYLVSSVKVTNSSIDYSDNFIGKPSNYHFSALEANWVQENQSNGKADLKLQIEDAGSAEANFHIQPKTKDFEGTITVAGIQLEPFYKYVVEYANINAISGELGAEIKLKGNIDTPESILVGSDITLSDFEMKDANNQTFLASKKLFSSIPKINYSKNSIFVKSIIIDQAYIDFELDSISNNYSRIFNLQSESTSDSKALDYFVQSFKVTNSVMDYSDNLTGEPFDYHFSAIEVNADDIGTHKDWVDIKSTMLLNNRGTLKAEIGINPNSLMTAQIDIAVENFLLSDLDIYSNYYMGHSILVGDMVYFSSTELKNGEMKSDNSLLIKNVDVRNNKGGLYAIPLKFAIWILKDRNGDIELDVPVSGNLNDPQVDTWALVWTTLKKRLFNATDNPVKPLARFIGAKPEDIERIAFIYPDTLITEEQGRQLDLILKLEKEKKGVGIEMNFLADTKILHDLIAEQMVVGLDSMDLKLPKIDKDLNQTLANTTLTDSLNSTTPNENLSANTVLLDSLATNYTEAVIRNVSGYVLDKNPQTQVIVQKAKVSDSDIIDASPHIKVKYSMRDEEENPE